MKPVSGHALRAGNALLLAACLSGCPQQGRSRGFVLELVGPGSGLSMTTTSGRTPPTQILEVKGAGGVALIDYDADEDLDVFISNGATLEAPEEGSGARLFENLGEMRFRDVTSESRLSLHRWGFGPAVGDFDGNGFDDVFVACYGQDAMLFNDGKGHFEERAEAAGLVDDAWSTAAACGDLDRDGDLDLYVANYLEFDPLHPPQPTTFLGAVVFGGPIGLVPQADRYFENQGDGTFVDATEKAGFSSAKPSFGLGVVILDFDGDGWQDVFVGNDSQPNFLFRNLDGGRFEDLGMGSGCAVDGSGFAQATMGIAVGDVDGNGLPDLFTTNFMDDDSTLHVQTGPLRFEDRTRSFGLARITRPYLKWATGFFDFDLDADEDLILVNGHVYPAEVTEPRGWRREQEPLLFERTGERFALVAPEALPGDGKHGAWLSEPRRHRSAAFGDLDQDGDVDLVTTELNGPVDLVRNGGRGGRWLVVELRDEAVQNHRALGSRIELQGGAARQVRWIYSGGSYQASSAPSAHFGLGRLEGALRLEITWPDGERQVVEGVAMDQRLVVRRAGSEAKQ